MAFPAYVRCQECGHLHFDRASRTFDDCPMAGCACRLTPDDEPPSALPEGWTPPPDLVEKVRNGK